MPFENQEGNLIHNSEQENPRVVEAPGDPVCTRMSRSIRAQPCIYQIEGLDKS